MYSKPSNKIYYLGSLIVMLLIFSLPSFAMGSRKKINDVYDVEQDIVEQRQAYEQSEMLQKLITPERFKRNMETLRQVDDFKKGKIDYVPNYREDDQKIFNQSEIISQARQLTKQGFYDQAIEKYKESMQPQYLIRERDKTQGIGGLVKIYQHQGKIKQAYETILWYDKIGWTVEFNKRRKPELEAIMKAQEIGSNKPIYDHINYWHKEYDKYLPPKRFQAGVASGVVSDTIRLYDYMGDFDAAIEYLDKRVLAYKHLRPNYRNEYLKVRQALLQDKAENRKSCITAKSRQTEGGQASEVCMGRATQVIIQSDVLPW